MIATASDSASLGALFLSVAVFLIILLRGGEEEE